MSTARHHAEWLSLLEISGPFLSMPVLLRAFPQGLDEHDPDVLRELRQAYEEWLDNQQGLRPDRAIHRAWVRHVLERTLELPPKNIVEGQAIPATLAVPVPEHGETLRPDLVIMDADKPRILIQVFPPIQDLDKPVIGSRWKESVATRAMELLRGTDVRLGLVTNGERWMLVDAPKNGTTGFISWYANLWMEEHITLRAFRSLLGAQRFFNVPENETLEELLKASATDQQEVTDQLGYQVRRAVEVLIQAIDRADQDRQRQLLAGIAVTTLYEAALTVMMRLVFLFSAEERKLLLLGDALYDANYAMSPLRAQLREVADQHGEEILERRYDAWCRLLATFRAVFSGVAHENMKLPAYGGSLFNPDRFPFLEGRASGTHWFDTPAEPLPINNRTVLHLLEALQILQVKVPGGGPAEARRLSFRALDIEQIGHVYEGLLDHTAVRASEPVLGLAGTKNQEPEIALAKLEAERAKGEESFVEFLRAETGRSASALKRAIEYGNSTRLRAACGNNEALFDRVKAFAGLIREDDFGMPVVIRADSVYMTAGTDRRSTGTHYTPRSLTEPIVQHTLELLLYVGPAEGLPREQWQLRSPAELIALKVCDMAMGSGAFLVQTDRYLAERLVESWGKAEDRIQKSEARSQIALRPRITPEGELATGKPGERIIPDDDDERMAMARRLVAERCLYGVDKNPLAVEMAKLSLWLVTAAKDRPFTFLDHALKCGDSLVGADAEMFERWTHSKKDSTMPLFDEELRRQLAEARQARSELESFEVNVPRDADRKQALLKKADEALERIKQGCDVIVGARLLKMKEDERADLLANALIDYVAGDALRSNRTLDAWEAAQRVRGFHWQFEFPEVFERGGFDAFVGNPPFIGGYRISSMFGDDYLRYLRTTFQKSHGQSDMCAFFFLRAFERLRDNGAFGLIATNTIAQGDTRETGLDQIVAKGGTIYFASASVAWPGVAAVYVSVIHIWKRKYNGVSFLDGKPVKSISSALDSTSTSEAPKILAENSEKSFKGTAISGLGFTLLPEEAKELIAKNLKNADVLFPFINGMELNTNPDQSPNRWVINFFDWTLEKAAEYSECLKIVREKVYPERQKHSDKKLRESWWLYERLREKLYEKISPFEQILVIAHTSKTLAFVFVPRKMVFSNAIIVIATDKRSVFSVLQSSQHAVWVTRFGSSLKEDMRYAPTDCFETFPFPADLRGLETIGEQYHEYRRQIMLARQEGLTATYNRFHNPEELSEDIARLRELHVEMDRAVAAAYGWQDLNLGHGFHKTAQGIRFTISEDARRELLARLLKLNHERWEEEQKAEGSGQKTVGGKQKTEGKKSKKVKESGEGYDEKLL